MRWRIFFFLHNSKANVSADLFIYVESLIPKSFLKFYLFFCKTLLIYFIFLQVYHSIYPLKFDIIIFSFKLTSSSYC